jgi:transcriptional regulator with XRE-family HTH domain
MSATFQATTLERAIARRLGEWREPTTMSLAEVSRKVGFSTAKLSKIENALQTVSADDLLTLALVYGVPQAERHSLYREAQRAEQQRAMMVLKQELLFDTTRDFIDLEFEASLVRTFKIDLLPGMFQTRSYIQALAKADDPLRSEVIALQRADLWEARKKRLFGPNPLEVHAVLSEAVIRSVVGGNLPMKSQLLHLMELSELPNVTNVTNVTNQIIPFSRGAYPAMGSPFDILSFSHELHGDVVYTENVTFGRYVEASEDLTPYTMRFAGLQRKALSPGESLELIAEVASTL